MQNYFNVNQVAFILKVHPLTIRRYIREGKLKAVKIGGSVRLQESDLQSFAKDFEPRKQRPVSLTNMKEHPAKEFSQEDPLLRLEGRGARIQLES